MPNNRNNQTAPNPLGIRTVPVKKRPNYHHIPVKNRANYRRLQTTGGTDGGSSSRRPLNPAELGANESKASFNNKKTYLNGKKIEKRTPDEKYFVEHATTYGDYLAKNDRILRRVLKNKRTISTSNTTRTAKEQNVATYFTSVKRNLGKKRNNWLKNGVGTELSATELEIYSSANFSVFQSNASKEAKELFSSLLKNKERKAITRRPKQ